MKSSWKILAVAFFCFATSCKNKGSAAIAEEKMIAVLTDVHIAEGALRQYHGNIDSTKKYASSYYDVIYKRHGVSVQQFNNAFSYYTENGRMEKILDRVQENLTQYENGTDKRMIKNGEK